MRVFKDTTGAVWTISLTAGAAVRLKAQAGLNVSGLPADGFKPLGELLADPERMLAALAAVARRQDGAATSAEQLGEAIDGDVYEAASEALVEEIVDFFPRAKRPLIRAALQKGKARDQVLTQRATAEVEAIDPEAEETPSPSAPLSVPPTSKDSSGAVPVSAASTPASSPSAS